MKAKAPTRDEWLAAIDAARQAPLPHSNALSLLELAAKVGMGRNGTGALARKLLATGKAILTKKMIRRNDGSLYPVPAYELVKEIADVRENRSESRRRRVPRRRRR